jgi:hypothetical protein
MNESRHHSASVGGEQRAPRSVPVDASSGRQSNDENGLCMAISFRLARPDVSVRRILDKHQTKQNDMDVIR